MTTLARLTRPTIDAAARYWWLGWTCLAACMVALGFYLDPVTAAGHHLLLIAGGVSLGIGLGRRSKE